MGRELKRKQAKREGRDVKIVNEKAKKELEPKTFGLILLYVSLFFVILYLITGLFVTKDIDWFSEKEVGSSDSSESISNKVLASDSLKQGESSYYVYFYNVKEEDSSISSLMDSREDKVYRVDLNDDFNSNYVGDASGIVEDIKDLKVSDPTVIKVVDGIITEFYDGSEKIKNSLS